MENTKLEKTGKKLTKEDILQMARLFGTPVQEQNSEIEYRFTLEGLCLLLSNVTLLEREACAKVVEADPSYDWHKFACEAAAAIRARGETTSRGQK